MTLADLAAEADELARAAKRLPTESYRCSPDLILEAKAELSHAINRLAGKIRKLAREDEPPVERPERGKFEPGIVAASGRIVRAELRNRVR